MTLPTTIRAAVSDEAITKVGRLFNGTIDDVLNELLQNARRAGASAVAIDVLDLAGHPTLVVSDDGCGIDDPASVLTLGGSGWGDAITTREDPAGIGVFSLAGHRVEIRSFSRSAGRGWRVVIPPDAWEASRPLDIEHFDHVYGTEILIDLSEPWEVALDRAAARAALYYPVPVSLRGVPLSRADWLADAVHIEQACGCRIGVHRGPRTWRHRGDTINFHGLTVKCDLPNVAETDGHSWYARVDIVDAPGLQLVLPTRKEMVATAALDALRDAVRIAIYRAIAADGSHRLGFAEWARARDAGVVLPEAEPWLPAWTPQTTDQNFRVATGEKVNHAAMIAVADFSPAIVQSAAQALGAGAPLGARLVDAVRAFEGYEWYDRIPHISELRFRFERGGAAFEYSDTSDFPELPSGPVDALTLVVEIVNYGEKSFHEIPAEMLVAFDDAECYDVDEAVILTARDAAVEPGILADLLEAICFSPCEDHDCDSWETQRERFRVEARQLATQIVLGDEAALLDRMRSAVRDHIAWLVPKDRGLTIKLDDCEVALALRDRRPPMVPEG